MRIALVSLAKGSGCPPIGLVYLGTYLQKYGHDVKIIDRNFTDDTPLAGWDIIGISAMTVHYDKAVEMGRFIKEMNPKVKVVIGGVHISTCSESFDPEAFDYAVIGEGELGFLELVKTLQINRVAKSSWQHDPIENLDDLPRPNWDLIDPRYFKEAPNTTFGEFGVEGWLLSSRGCPYDCSFCSTRQMWGKPRFHSVFRVIEMIDDLVNKGSKHIQIWDDLFTINRKRLREIAYWFPGYKTKVKFNCQPRTDLIDDELCELLTEMGVNTCIFGFESGSDKTIKYLKNDTCTVGDNKKAILTCRKHGLKVQGSVIIGCPEETSKDMCKTIEFIEWAYKHGVERIWTFMLTPFPGTELWKQFKKGPDFKWSDLSHQGKPLMLNEKVTPRQWGTIMYLINEMERKFKILKLITFIRHAPLKTLKYALTHWREGLKLARGRT